MRKILTFFLLVPSLSYSQNYNREDIIGEWKILKCEIFLNNTLYKSSYINETNFKVLDGRNMGEFDSKINEILTIILGTNVIFNEDSTVTLDPSLNDLITLNIYWQFFDSSILAFYKWEDRVNLRPLLFKCEIITILSNKMYLKAFEFGLNIKMTLNR
jgi:hypothetical protein